MYLNLDSLLLIATILTSASAAPAPPATGGLKVNPCSPATAERKKLFTSKGAPPEYLAITIQETDCRMSSAYDFGDNKENDSACFGPFKVNWHTMRTYCSQFKGQKESDWRNGKALNNDDDPTAAITCLREQMNAPEVKALPGGWPQLQRNGVTNGACGPDPTGSIYKGAIQQITNYLNAGHLTDNTQINPEVTAC